MKSKANNIFEFKELRISVITQTWVRLEIVFFLDLSSKNCTRNSKMACFYVINTCGLLWLYDSTEFFELVILGRWEEEMVDFERWVQTHLKYFLKRVKSYILKWY